MPLTLTLTEGVLPKGQERTALVRLSEAMLKWHGLAGNPIMKRNLVGSIHLLPREATFSGLQETPLVAIEWKVPSFAFTQRDVQIGYFEEATAIIQELSEGRLLKEHIYINVTHAVDGAWNWEGRALTNAEIGVAISA